MDAPIEDKKLEAAVDKILASFDTISEWPDIIGFLTRLIKVVGLI